MPAAPPAETVLVVEDDRAVREAIERGLNVHGFAVATAPSAEDALARFDGGDAGPPDVVIVDVGLPGMSGVDLCRRLRDRDVELPLLILSARDDVGDRVAGLQAGADDYLVKPFDLSELVARLGALLRRARVHRERSSALTAGRLTVDEDRRTASVGDRVLDLTRREFDLLATFAHHPRQVLSRIQLLELVWGYDFAVDTNVVDVFVGYLRKKLEAGGEPRLIETVRGVGFVLEPDR